MNRDAPAIVVLYYIPANQEIRIFSFIDTAIALVFLYYVSFYCNRGVEETYAFPRILCDGIVQYASGRPGKADANSRVIENDVVQNYCFSPICNADARRSQDAYIVLYDTISNSRFAGLALYEDTAVVNSVSSSHGEPVNDRSGDIIKKYHNTFIFFVSLGIKHGIIHTRAPQHYPTLHLNRKYLAGTLGRDIYTSGNLNYITAQGIIHTVFDTPIWMVLGTFPGTVNVSNVNVNDGSRSRRCTDTIGKSRPVQDFISGLQGEEVGSIRTESGNNIIFTASGFLRRRFSLRLNSFIPVCFGYLVH